MKNLKFEDLMNLFLRSKKNKNYEEILSIHQEFERRVEKRKLMGKKLMKTSISGFEQTKLWLNNNEDLAKKNIKKVNNIKSKRRNLRNENDINKKNTLW